MLGSCSEDEPKAGERVLLDFHGRPVASNDPGFRVSTSTRSIHLAVVRHTPSYGDRYSVMT